MEQDECMEMRNMNEVEPDVEESSDDDPRPNAENDALNGGENG